MWGEEEDVRRDRSTSRHSPSILLTIENKARSGSFLHACGRLQYILGDADPLVLLKLLLPP
jgi:hypothetical protein